MDESSDNTILIFSVIKEAMLQQRHLMDALETKAGVLIGLGGVIFGLLMDARTDLLSLSQAGGYVILASILLFAISMLLSIMSIWIRPYYLDPIPGVFAKKYINKTAEETRLQLISNWGGSWDKNNQRVKFMGQMLRAAFIIQTAAFLLLAVVLVVVVTDRSP